MVSASEFTELLASAAALVLRLSEPAPRDVRATRQLAQYKGLVPRWHDWSAVTDACAALADDLVARREPESGR